HPLVRRDLPEPVRLLSAKPALKDLALTTNGVLLAETARDLKEAGLKRVTVSLDTLKADRFQALTRFDEHARVLAGVEGAAGRGFESGKLDSVVVRGGNEGELVPLLQYGRPAGAGRGSA